LLEFGGSTVGFFARRRSILEVFKPKFLGLRLEKLGLGPRFENLGLYKGSAHERKIKYV